MPTPISWPKPYLLKIYEKTIDEGCCRVRVESKEQATSLILSFYRLRRRSDAQHSSFIKPEYHLVTGTYESATGAVLFTYSHLPDGAELPEIESVPESERFAGSTAAVPQPGIQPNEEGEPVDLDALMADLLKDAHQKITGEQHD